MWLALLHHVAIQPGAPAQLGLGTGKDTVIGIPLGRITHGMFVKDGLAETCLRGSHTWPHDDDIQKPAGSRLAACHGSVNHWQTQLYCMPGNALIYEITGKFLHLKLLLEYIRLVIASIRLHS